MTKEQHINKKQYSRPELVRYGTLHAITQAAGQIGDLDGGFAGLKTGKIN